MKQKYSQTLCSLLSDTVYMSLHSGRNARARNVHIIESEQSIQNVLIHVHVLEALVWDRNFLRSDRPFADYQIVRSQIVEVGGEIPALIEIVEDDDNRHDPDKCPR